MMYKKQDLISLLCESEGDACIYQTKAEAEKAVNGVLEGIKSMVCEEDSEGVNLTGFGAFKKIERKAREGRNPATGATIQIAAKTSANFKLGKAFKDALN